MSDIILKKKDYDELSNEIFKLMLEKMEKDKEIDHLKFILKRMKKYVIQNKDMMDWLHCPVHEILKLMEDGDIDDFI